MATTPPRVAVSDLVTFAVLDELIRTFVDHGDLTGHEAASMLDRVIANVRAMNVDGGGKAILETMRDEYREADWVGGARAIGLGRSFMNYAAARQQTAGLHTPRHPSAAAQLTVASRLGEHLAAAQGAVFI